MNILLVQGRTALATNRNLKITSYIPLLLSKVHTQSPLHQVLDYSIPPT